MAYLLRGAVPADRHETALPFFAPAAQL